MPTLPSAIAITIVSRAGIESAHIGFAELVAEGPKPSIHCAAQKLEGEPNKAE